ncbi:hypothetical protein JKP88DRAFT_353473 [Tribonema minus]|uniref:Uncharacterized protein n=1 Tax=Tribonema minus TaxID=303371 RepID=A0A835Z7R8_9STRA|nr:hypothetical protein JKP88DRAFT_353473 [Tribonema minus]
MREISVFEYAHEHEGLFGGYSFYTYYYCTTLLSVEEATFITARKPLALGERRFQFGANTLPMMNKALFAHDSAAGGEITLECPQFEESMRFVPLACLPDGVPALGISLFPRAPRNPDNANLSRLFSEAVTNGVRVRFSAVMCPQVAPAGQIVWAYRLGLRLLRRHPTNMRALECCQLTRRHWNITDDSVRETQQPKNLLSFFTKTSSSSSGGGGGGSASSTSAKRKANSIDAGDGGGSSGGDGSSSFPDPAAVAAKVEAEARLQTTLRDQNTTNALFHTRFDPCAPPPATLNLGRWAEELVPVNDFIGGKFEDSPIAFIRMPRKGAPKPREQSGGKRPVPRTFTSEVARTARAVNITADLFTVPDAVFIKLQGTIEVVLAKLEMLGEESARPQRVDAHGIVVIKGMKEAMEMASDLKMRLVARGAMCPAMHATDRTRVAVEGTGDTAQGMANIPIIGNVDDMLFLYHSRQG